MFWEKLEDMFDDSVRQSNEIGCFSALQCGFRSGVSRFWAREQFALFCSHSDDRMRLAVSFSIIYSEFARIILQKYPI